MACKCKTFVKVNALLRRFVTIFVFIIRFLNYLTPSTGRSEHWWGFLNAGTITILFL